MNNPTPNEMEQAADWLRSYESYADDPLRATYEKVAVFLERKAEQQRTDEAVTQIVKKSGSSRAQARKKLKEIMAKR